MVFKTYQKKFWVSLKYLYGFSFSYLMKRLGMVEDYVTPSQYISNFKTSDVLFVLAPGSSVNDISFEDFQHISKHDSVAVNFFSLHPFNAKLNLIEPYSPKLKYFSSKDDEVFKKNIFFKGYSSPSSFLPCVRNLIEGRKASARIFLLIDSGEYSILPNLEKDTPFPDSFNLGGSSLLYCLSFALKTNYRKVVLCGFDMDSRYFYQTVDAPSLSSENAKARGLFSITHNFADASPLQTQLIRNFINFQNEVASAGLDFEILSFKMRGKLTEYTAEYEQGSN